MKKLVLKLLKSKLLKKLILLAGEELVKRTDNKLDDKALEVIKKTLE